MSILSSGAQPEPVRPLDETEQARAGLYRLLAGLLSHPPTPALLDVLRALPVGDEDTAVGVALGRLALAARTVNPEAARREYDVLFVGIARGELVPYASFYLTGFLHDRPLARLRETLAELGLVAVPGHPDPEDHAGTICELMAGLIDGGYGVQQPLDVQRRFFERHVENWLGRFFLDLEAVRDVELYAYAGALGRAFLAVEALAFEMEAL